MPVESVAVPSPSIAVPSPSLIEQFCDSYARWTETRPYITAALTCAVISGSGDWICQEFIEPPQAKRVQRSMAVLLDALFVTGPGQAWLYRWLEDLVPSEKWKGKGAWIQVIVDTFIFDPMFAFSFFITTALMEHRARWLLDSLRNDYSHAVFGGWAVSLAFLPVQVFMFRLIPVQYRSFAVNLIDVVWNAVVSLFGHAEVHRH